MILALLLVAAPVPIAGTSLQFLGWSQDTRRIALIHYYEGQTINHSCVMRVFVQDLMTDKVEWELKKAWGEDPRDGRDNCPKNFAAAWKRVATEVESELATRQISAGVRITSS